MALTPWQPQPQPAAGAAAATMPVSASKKRKDGSPDKTVKNEKQAAPPFKIH